MAAEIAAFALTSVYANDSRTRDLPHPLVAGSLATIFTNLPDLIEPATSSDHRQFFHSIVFARGIIYGLKRTYDWKPMTICNRALRHILLIAGGAYLIHLALDASTSRSLPLIGK